MRCAKRFDPYDNGIVANAFFFRTIRTSVPVCGGEENTACVLGRANPSCPRCFMLLNLLNLCTHVCPSHLAGKKMIYPFHYFHFATDPVGLCASSGRLAIHSGKVRAVRNAW